MLRHFPRSAQVVPLMVSLLGMAGLTSGCFEGREYNLDNASSGTSDGGPGCLPYQCDGTCCGDVCVASFENNPAHCGGCDNACTRFETCAGDSCSCTPDCTGRICGDDGCGGTCGDCPSGEVCSSREDDAVCIDGAVGCADGTREGFTDLDVFPAIASCAADWPILDLRRRGSGYACGNDIGGDCRAPRDACAPGWHICMVTGDPEDLRGKVSGEACASADGGNGRFAVASDYDDGDGSCEDTPYGCTEGRVALCCGSGCELPVRSCVWPETAGAAMDTVCKAVSDADGVVCCRD